MVKIIVWDADGTLFYDEGKNYDDPGVWTPLIEMLKLLQNNETYNILVTGRDHVPLEMSQYFKEVHCRPFPVEPYNTYYSRYHQWKLETIVALKPDLVIDDDQQICRACLGRKIKAIWVPQNAFMTKLGCGVCAPDPIGVRN